MESRRRFLASLALLTFPLACARAQEPAVAARVPDVIYGKKLGVALTMDVFKPAKPNGIGVLWMVSGGWVSDHKNISPEVAKVFTDRGITVFEVVHGTQPKFTLPEIVQDIHRAVRFVRTNAATFGVDPNRLGISGGSAGGHLSLLISATGGPGDQNSKDPVERASSATQAAGVFFPPTDFSNYGKDGQHAFTNPLLKGYWPAFGVTDATTTEEKLKLEATLSPLGFMTSAMPPTLLIHGDADFLVPLQQSKLVVAKLTELKVPVKLIVEPGKGHGWTDMAPDLAQIAEWFEKYLAKK